MPEADYLNIIYPTFEKQSTAMTFKKLHNNSLFFISCSLFIILFSSCKFRQKADMIIHHAKIYTVNEKFSTAEAMVVRDGKIIATGTNEDILKEFESDVMEDAKGKAIFPGFIDAHAHFVGYGFSLQRVNLVGTGSWEEVLSRCSEFAKGLPAGQWLTGRGGTRMTGRWKSFQLMKS